MNGIMRVTEKKSASAGSKVVVAVFAAKLLVGGAAGCRCASDYLDGNSPAPKPAAGVQAAWVKAAKKAAPPCQPTTSVGTADTEKKRLPTPISVATFHSLDLTDVGLGDSVAKRIHRSLHAIVTAFRPKLKGAGVSLLQIDIRISAGGGLSIRGVRTFGDESIADEEMRGMLKAVLSQSLQATMCNPTGKDLRYVHYIPVK